ncbi:unnamed protein product, partial [marine sediment metagenome]
ASGDVSGAISAKTASIMDFVNAYGINIMNPKLICGMFLGAVMAFMFCAMTMKAVGRVAGTMVNEVRRQFKEIPGIMELRNQAKLIWHCLSVQPV